MTEPKQHVDVVARVRELDEALARRELASEASERVRAGLQQRALEQRVVARLRWWPMVAFLAGAAVMAAAVLIGQRERERERDIDEVVVDVDTGSEDREVPTPELSPRPEPIVAPQLRCTVASVGVTHSDAGECVVGDGVRLTARVDSSFTWAADRVELDAGELAIDVAPRPDRPLTVVVGAASIEVIGTSFVVNRDAAGGWISLTEGHVRVRVGERRATDLHAGQRLDWRDDEPRVDKAAPEPDAEQDAGLVELLEEVAALRRSGDFQGAVERLRAGERDTWSARARQLVSYEIGSLLERQLHDTEAACAHWAVHRQRFPDGRHASMIAASVERMGCGAR